MLPPDLSRYTGYLVRRAQQVHAGLWQEEGQGDVTSVQFGVLALLESNPGIDQRALGALMQLDRSTIADIVSRMERRGLLDRTRDAADRRRKILALTAQGRSELADLRPRAERINDALVATLNADEQAELRRLLGRLIEGAAQGTEEASG